jgi:predicted Zn-dependent protease
VKLADPQDLQRDTEEVRPQTLAAGEIEIPKHIRANHVIFVKEGEVITRTMHSQKMVTARHSIKRERSRLNLLSQSCLWLALLFVPLLNFLTPAALTQEAAQQEGAQIEGIVRDAVGKPVAGVSVRLLEETGSSSVESQTNGEGIFFFREVRSGMYSVKVEIPGFRDLIEKSIKLGPAEKKHCDFVLQASTATAASSAASSSLSAIEFDDRPSFTVAGITDSTAGSGHGSETRMRTGEALAKATLNLESGESAEIAGAAPKAGNSVLEAHTSESELRAALRQSPRGFEANHNLGEFYLHSRRCSEAISFLRTAYQTNPADHVNAFDFAQALSACEEVSKAREQLNQMLANDKGLGTQDEASLRRLLGDLDERLDDPLAAARQYERAAASDSSEQNYFAWGAELLLHRAAAPAVEVFARGARLHPDSARMLAGLGAALYTSGSAEEAAQRLCEASDLDPSRPAPYLFLGKMQEAASASLPCAEQKLARFAHDQPENALANYYYAIALWKRDRGSEDSDALAHAIVLLQRSAAIDPKFDLANLQLGNIYLVRGALQEALVAYQKSVAANPGNSEAHYRLVLTYKRLGEEANAQREFAEYKQLDQAQAAAVERERRELRQFLFVLKDQPKE